MKGFVFTVRNNRDRFCLPDLSGHFRHIRSILKKYGLQAVLALLFLFGTVVGAASARSVSRDVVDQMDLLFVTNISARLDMNFPQIFLSCFVSYFLFAFGAFLCGISVWGFAAVPLLSAFKGFTVGLSSGFIFSQYRMSGFGFYILVILPGTLLFLSVLLHYSAHCFRLSRRYAGLSLLGSDREPELRSHLKRFLNKSLLVLLSVIACAVTDMLLWMLFANKFQF